MSDEKHGDSKTSDVRATLGPIVFKIAMEQQTIRELFGLLRQVFNILDSEMNQSIPISRARATLAEYELTSGMENKEFQLVTQVPGQMTYREFTSFFAAQLVSTCTSPSTSTDDIKSDLTDAQRDRLGPVVFRLASRVDEFHRIFKLFRTMFDVFDKGHTGSISKNDLLQLVEQDFLDIKEFENFTRLKTVKADASTFPEFLAFWIHSFVESEEEEESQLRQQLSPIIFKIGLEMTTIGELFTLLQQLYQVFDVKKEGSVDKKDLLVLQEFELLDNETRARLLSTKGNAEGRITFPEFATFIAGTFLHKSIHANDVKTPEDEKSATSTEEIPVPEHIAKGVPPLLFRLSSRSGDLLRVFDLFHKMFDIIDHDHDGLIAKSDLKKLQEFDFLEQKQIDEMERWNSNTTSTSMNLPDFVTFWVAHLVQTTLEQQVANVKISA